MEERYQNKVDGGGNNTELAVGPTQVLLVKEAARTVVSDEVDKGISTRQTESEGFTKVRVTRNAVINRGAMQEAEIDDDARFAGTTECDLEW